MGGALSGSFAAALLEAVGVGVHLQDVDVVGDAVEQCAGEPLGAEDLGPLVEGQVAGDQRRGALVALADGLEEQLGAGLRQRHIAQFVDDQQLVGGELLLEAPQVLLVAGLDQFADQSGGGDEANAMAALTSCQTERQGDVGLAGAAVAEQQDVFLAGRDTPSAPVRGPASCSARGWRGSRSCRGSSPPGTSPAGCGAPWRGGRDRAAPVRSAAADSAGRSAFSAAQVRASLSYSRSMVGSRRAFR